jgi:hypothetical protein
VNRSYRRILVTGAWVRRRLWLEASLPRFHRQFHIGDEFWQLVLAVETAPGFLCALDELEHHGECGLLLASDQITMTEPVAKTINTLLGAPSLILPGEETKQ